MASNAIVTDPSPKKSKIGLIIGLLLGCGCLALIVVGIIAAIVIPSLARARTSANGAMARGDVRAVISAQAVYQSVTGEYGTLECLAAPASCIRGYSGPEILSQDLLLKEKGGYRRTLTLSGRARHYTYIAVPVSSSTGTQAFCGDSNGIVCQTTDGAVPKIGKDGDCNLDGCSPL